MKKALILHCWLGSPEGDWYPWLKKELEKKGYEVWVPELPTMASNKPEMGSMLKMIKESKFVDKETIVIGHSLGAVLMLRLAERVKFAKGIALAVWDYNDLTPEHQSFWEEMTDHKTIIENVPEWVVLLSDNDPYVTKFIGNEVAGRLGAKVVEVGEKGHFLAKEDGITEVPEILELV